MPAKPKLRYLRQTGKFLVSSSMTKEFAPCICLDLNSHLAASRWYSLECGQAGTPLGLYRLHTDSYDFNQALILLRITGDRSGQ
jgi:hypothetical protein